MLRTPLLAQKVVCSEDDDDDGREALIDRTAPPTVKKRSFLVKLLQLKKVIKSQ